MAGLISELRRRKVFRVLVAYVVAAWLLLQVADLFASILSLPDWAPKLVLFLLVIGLVPALILAWAYESTPEGIKRDVGTPQGAEKVDFGSLRGAVVVAGVLIVAVIGASLYWFAGADGRWVRDVALPQIEQSIEKDRWEEAYATAMEIQSRIPDSPALAGYWSEFTVKTSIPSQPEGAVVYRRSYEDKDADWQLLGRTPIYDVLIPRGFSLLRIEMPGFSDVLRVVGVMPLAGGWQSLGAAEGPASNWLVVPPVDIVLDPTSPPEDQEVRVPGTVLFLDGRQVPLADFHIGRFEVTNRDFKAFVDAGAYQQRDYWEQAFVLDGRTIGWDEAMAAFRDTTGRPGPATWIGGTYPEGQADYPVGGISWYEAMAYARYAGQELPTLHHWRRAHAQALVTWQILKSNIGTDRPARVGEYEGTGWTGTYDMLGNVREWVFNALGDKRAIVGGAWDDLSYLAPASIYLPQALPPFDRSPQNGVRLASLHDERSVRDLLREPVEPEQPIEIPEPVSDEAFAVMLQNFEQGDAPLSASIDESVKIRDWTREHISFDRGDGQRSEFLLYLPDGRPSRHRTIFYWPSSLPTQLTSLDDYRLPVDFLLRSGWAVALPIFEGTFHRGGGQWLPRGSVAARDLAIRQLREMRRIIDYLETRRDVDAESIGYFGTSWGGWIGALALAVEPRLRVGILNQAGFHRLPQSVLHPVNYLPRVRQPALQYNGRYDTGFRYEDSAKPYFDLLGSEFKKHVVEPTGHFVPNSVVIGETLSWLDEHMR